MSVPSCALERARRASVHTRILPFFVSASSCPVTVIVAQAVGEGPYVSAGTANDSEGNVRKLNPEDFRTRNFDGLDFERGFFPLPGQLVEGLTLMLGR